MDALHILLFAHFQSGQICILDPLARRRAKKKKKKITSLRVSVCFRHCPKLTELRLRY